MSEKWWEDDPEAHRQGFGIVFHKKGDHWEVHRALKGSPAEAAGVKSGDVIHAINGNALERPLRPTKLTATIEMLNSDSDHEVALFRGKEKIVTRMRPRVLSELFEIEASQGGVLADYCYSCPTCYSRTSGVVSCSDCPGYNCTIA